MPSQRYRGIANAAGAERFFERRESAYQATDPHMISIAGAREMAPWLDTFYTALLRGEEARVITLFCDKCHLERLVAFSCKKRGFCPSCGARRMADTAALLADEVFPDVPLRQ